MISITASGFIAGKPELQIVGTKRARKCEFAVVDTRRALQNGTWQDVWERVTFVAWDEEAERIASTLDKGFHVSCTGLQETNHWEDSAGGKHKSVKYKLTAWSIERKPRQSNDRDAAPPGGAQQQERRRAPPAASQNGPAQGGGPDQEDGGHDHAQHPGFGPSQSGGLLEM